MPKERARQIFESGRGHALAADLLFHASINEARARGLDPELFSFNGTYSLSVHNLLGLGLELMLKAAIIELDDEATDVSLRKIGHNLVSALNAAEAAGLQPDIPQLRNIVEVLDKPYRQHWFRYDRPAQFALPADFGVAISAIAMLDEQLRLILWTPQELAAFDALP